MDTSNLEEKTEEGIKLIRASGSISYPVSEERKFRRTHEDVSINDHFILIHYQLTDSGRIYLVYFPAEQIISNTIN